MHSHAILPSRFFLAVAAPCVCAALVGGLYLLYEREDASRKDNAALAVAAPAEGGFSIEHAVVSQDSDGDGLFDWEEALWNTDPAVQDTDADSVSDGDEVRQGRDPAVPGTGEAPKVADEPSALVPPESATEAMGKEFMASYLLYKQTGTLNEAATQELLNKTIARGLSNSFGRLHTNEELTLAPDSSPESYRAYKEAVEGALDMMEEIKQNDLVLLGAIVEKKDEAAKEELRKLTAKQGEVVEALVKVPVPAELATLHLQFVNNLSMYTFILESLTEPEKDPLRTLQTAYRYEKVVKDMRSSFDEIALRVRTKLS